MFHSSSSSSSSLSLCARTAHDDSSTTCICAVCKQRRKRTKTDCINDRTSCLCEFHIRYRAIKEKDALAHASRRQKMTNCINDRNSCLCEFHIRYRAIKEKDALAHASRRQKMTTPEKVSLNTNIRNKKNDRKIIQMNQLADSLRSETLTNYTIASKTVFSRHEIDELDNNLDFDKYAGTHFIYSKRYNVFNFITN